MPTDDIMIPPHAEVAMLRLQVRAAERELESVRSAVTQLSEMSATDAVAQLQARFLSMIEERRRAHEAELDDARRAAAERIAAVETDLATLRESAGPPPSEFAPSVPVDQSEIVEWNLTEAELESEVPPSAPVTMPVADPSATAGVEAPVVPVAAPGPVALDLVDEWLVSSDAPADSSSGATDVNTAGSDVVDADQLVGGGRGDDGAVDALDVAAPGGADVDERETQVDDCVVPDELETSHGGADVGQGVEAPTVEHDVDDNIERPPREDGERGPSSTDAAHDTDEAWARPAVAEGPDAPGGADVPAAGVGDRFDAALEAELSMLVVRATGELEAQLPELVDRMRSAFESELPLLVRRVAADAGHDDPDMIERTSAAIAAEIPDVLERGFADLEAELPDVVERITATVVAGELPAAVDRLASAVVDDVAATTVGRLADRIAAELGRHAPSAAHRDGSLPTTLTLVLDPESFAEAFAVALGERASIDPPRYAGYPTSPQPPVPKRSFWANTWHADVVLALIALVVVVVVLIAWST